MNPTPTFTEQQLQDWHAYEKVRLSARFNMYDLRARIATGLTDARYDFVIENFAYLREAAQHQATS